MGFGERFDSPECAAFVKKIGGLDFDALEFGELVAEPLASLGAYLTSEDISRLGDLKVLRAAGASKQLFAERAFSFLAEVERRYQPQPKFGLTLS